MHTFNLDQRKLTLHKNVWSDDDLFLAKCLWFEINPSTGVITIDLPVTLQKAVGAFLRQAFPAFMHQQQYEEQRLGLARDVRNVYRELRAEYERDYAPKIPYWDKLYNHQKDTAVAIIDRQANLLGMQQRTGKTITAGSHSLAIGAKRTLVLCYDIGKYNWLKDLTDKKWTVNGVQPWDEYDFTILDSNKRKCRWAWNERFVIVNYEAAQKYLKYLVTNGSRVTDHIVMDEAQRIKNAHSGFFKTAQAIVAALPEARLTLATGTPVMNRVDDLYSYFRISSHPLGGSRADYDTRFLQRVGSRGKVSGAKNTEMLSAVLSNFQVRVLFSDCSDMPPKQHIRLYFPIGEWRDKYMEAIRRAVEMKGAGINDAYIHQINNIMAQAKVPGVFDHIQQTIEEGQKVVVFTWYSEPLNLLEEMLLNAGVNYVRVDGGVSDAKEKMARATKFQEDPDCMVFIGNGKAAGHTIPLHAANIAIMLNQPLTPKDLDQAMSRLEHLEKKDVVTIYYATCIGDPGEDTVDMKLTDLNMDKLSDINAVVDGGKDINNTENTVEVLFDEIVKQYGHKETA